MDPSDALCQRQDELVFLLTKLHGYYGFQEPALVRVAKMEIDSMDLLGHPMNDSHLPFSTEEDRAALVGRSIRYVCASDISDMGGKPHLLPQVGVVKAADHSGIVLDSGVRLLAEDIKLISAA